MTAPTLESGGRDVEREWKGFSVPPKEGGQLARV